MIVAINILLQVLDGLLTYIGLTHGHLEGNPLIASMIPSLGFATPLITVKCWSCAMIVTIRKKTDALRSLATFMTWVVVVWLVVLGATL